MADFRLCSTSESHSQAGLDHYAASLESAYLRTPPLLFVEALPQIPIALSHPFFTSNWKKIGGVVRHP